MTAQQPSASSRILWLYREIGRAIVQSEMAAAGRPMPDDGEIEGMQQALIMKGWEWRCSHLHQLRALYELALRAETNMGSQPRELQAALLYVRTHAPGILSAMGDDAGIRYMAAYIADNGEGNREQLMIFLGSLQMLISE